MNNNHYRRDTCRTCLSNKIELVLPLPATPVGDAYKKTQQEACNTPLFPMDLYLCNSCGQIQLNDVVSPDLLYGHFTYETKISLGLNEHFRKYASDISTKLKLSPKSLVIDIGSNDGTLLKAFKGLGYSVLGIDPAVTIAAKATSEGIRTLPELFTTEAAIRMREEFGTANLIVANNTIANIDDLDDFMRGVGTLLGSEGTFVIETGYGPDIIHYGLFDTIYHEHISYFTVGSLEALGKRTGFTLVDAERIATKGGSLRAFFRWAKGDPTVQTSVSELKAYEQSLETGRPAKYKELEKKLGLAKNKLHEYLDGMKKQKATICGYGASVGSTTFNYVFELGQSFKNIFDDNPVKFNVFSPGQGISVLSSQEIYKNPPDAIVIISFRYAEPIVAKHEKYISNGGKFILPWPEFKQFSK